MGVKAGERRIVTAFVADVAGSTAIAERLGPERSKFLFDDVVRLMREEVERFGGTVAQLTGDGVFALFGVPVAHEADAERAVRAGLALHEALARYAAELAPAYGIDLTARIAVNTGPVVVPTGDAPADVLYNALGDTVNVAARLQALGDLVVGPTTAHQVRDLFHLEELGEIELKGKSRPVAAFRVLGLRDGRPARVETPLVGRGREVTTLNDALDGLFGGRGVIVSITGEPGIGKSRLVAEAQKRFDGRVQFLVGHAIAYADTIPYWPVREMLRSWLDLGVSDSEVRARLELRTGLAQALTVEADDAYPFVATVLGLTLEPGQAQRMRDLAPDSLRHETFYWLYRLVSGLALERPVCVVLDDLQWSDEATLALLDELLPAVEGHPIAFMLVHRSDPDHPAWQRVDRARRRFHRLFVELDLQPLTDGDVHELAEADAGAVLPGALARILAERAGGNPYFVGEALQDLRERGALVREGDRLVLLGDASLPAALQEAVQARLDRLRGDARDLITTAAVIGRIFGLQLLERLLPSARLPPTLSELQWLGLVVEERGGAAPEYRFRHGVVQEVAYSGLLEAHRRDLHRQVGDALVGLHPDSPAEVEGLLAHHYAEADEPAPAIEHLLRAGDAARAAYARDEAIELYRRALGFMERIGEDARARRTLFKIGLAHHLAFDYRAANEAFGEGFARRLPPPTRLEPTERIHWALPEAWDRTVAPGYCTGLQCVEVTRNLFRGLVASGPDMDIEPDAVERFTVSDDGLTYRFTLRSDATWSDGVPVTAGDFAFAFSQMVEEDVASASWLEGVTATAVDERTLEVGLREARNTFLYALTQPPFFPWPRHIHEQHGRDWHRRVPLVGNGPFVLTGREGGRVVLDAAPNSFGPRGNIAQVIIDLEPTPDVAMERWRHGTYDVLDQVLEHRYAAYDRTIVQRAPGMTTSYLGFNARRAPLDDVRVRRALAHAVDTRGPTETTGGTAAIGGGLLPPTMSGHSQRVAPPYDPDRAIALLREAGYADPADLGEIELATLSLWTDGASVVAAQLARIGIRTRLVIAVLDPDLDRVIEAGAHLYLWGWVADYPDAGRGFLDSLLAEMPALYRDEGLEDLLARARSLRDEDERSNAYREFERRWIGEQAALLPISYSDTRLLTRSWVTGMWVNSIEISTFAQAVVTRPAE